MRSGWNLIGKRWYSPLNILFFGSDEFSVHSLRALTELKDRPIKRLQVVTRQPKRCGRSKSLMKNVPIVSATNQLELAPPEYCESYQDMLRLTGLVKSHQFNMIVAVSFGKLIPAQLLNHVPYSLNVHPSLLPRYKGASPIQYTLLNRDKYSGVTIQTLHPDKFDHGSIIAQTSPLRVQNLIQNGIISEFESHFPRKTAALMDQLGLQGGNLLKHVIKNGLYTTISPLRPSYDSCYASKINSEMKRLRWITDTAETSMIKLETLGPTYAFKQVDENKSNIIVDGIPVKRIIFYSSKKVDSLPFVKPGEFIYSDHDQCIYVQCQLGALKIEKLQFEGFKIEEPKQFMTSLKKRCGTDAHQVHVFL